MRFNDLMETMDDSVTGEKLVRQRREQIVQYAGLQETVMLEGWFPVDEDTISEGFYCIGELEKFDQALCRLMSQHQQSSNDEKEFNPDVALSI